MPTTSDLPAIANVIQLTIAPVFLLTGIGGLYAFLREVYIASDSTSIDAHRFDLPSDP